MSSAEDYKALGNKAFSAKNYDEAIEFYTKAINADKSNHVFYSNRSASYAAQRKWDNAISDAKECIRLDPTFIKGYYRLATSQIENNDLDAAIASIKQGLNIDPDNSQLQKLIRSIKLKKQMMKKTEKQSDASKLAVSAASAAGAVGGRVDEELMDLQTQLSTTIRDYRYVNADFVRVEKNKRVNEITIAELDALPQDSDTKMYMSVGKMFMASSRDNVYEQLETEIKDFEKKANDLTQKKEYLERRMKSQQQNIVELTSNARQ